MTRNSALAAILLLSGAATALVSKSGGRQGAFTWGELKVTNFDPDHFDANFQTGTFSIQGRPQLHAVFAKKHLTIDATRLEGTADVAAKLVKTAKLSGGVKGSMDAATKDGQEHVTFAGPTVDYTSVGAAQDQLADIEVSGGVNFASSNSTLNRVLTLTGSHGKFRVHSGDQLGLESADLDGPVNMKYQGFQASFDKNKKATRTPVTGVAAGGHLRVRRAEGSGNYLVRISEGVHLRELTGPNAGAELTTTAINLEFDTAGNLVRSGSDSASTATVPVGKGQG